MPLFIQLTFELNILTTCFQIQKMPSTQFLDQEGPKHSMIYRNTKKQYYFLQMRGLDCEHSLWERILYKTFRSETKDWLKLWLVAKWHFLLFNLLIQKSKEFWNHFLCALPHQILYITLGIWYSYMIIISMSKRVFYEKLQKLYNYK